MPKTYRRKINPTEQELRTKWLGPVNGPYSIAEDVLSARIARARDAAARGLNMRQWAAEEGASAAAITMFLARPDVPKEVGEALRRQNDRATKPAIHYYWMLKCLVLMDAGLWSGHEIAERHGVTGATLTCLRKRKVPDGNLREALELLGYEVFGDDVLAERDVESFYQQVLRAVEVFSARPADPKRWTGHGRHRRVALRNAETKRKEKAHEFLKTNLA